MSVQYRELVRELEFAINHDQLTVAFQPIVEMTGSSIVAYEALCRWSHPAFGTISPEVFIPTAEKSGLIHCLGLAVLKQAARFAHTVPSSVSIAVNLSPRQLERPAMANRLLSVITEEGLQPSRFDFEVTETVVLKCNDTTLKNLRALKDSGGRVSLDDFGTGYSSLSLLQLALFDTIKIDKTFVQNVFSSDASGRMVGALIGFAQALSLEVTAEGVEDAETSSFLKSRGCDFAQGYLFGRPEIPASRQRSVGTTNPAERNVSTGSRRTGACGWRWWR